MIGGTNKCILLYWPQCVLTKVYADTILVGCLVEINSIDGITYWETNLSISCPHRTVVRGNVANIFLMKIFESLHQEMWLANFHMRSAKKLEVHKNLHIDTHSHKVVSLENVKVCCTTWYIIHAVSKADVYRF